MMDAKIQSEHHYVLCESKSIFLALVVNDVEDVRGGEVIDGTTFFQIRVDVIAEYLRKAMTGNVARLQSVADCGPFYLVYKKD